LALPGLGSIGLKGGAKTNGGESDPQTEPRVLPGRITRTGSLPKEVIRRVIRKHRREVLDCYQRELKKDDTLGGRLLVSFTITKTGRVVAVSTKKDTVGNKRLSQCVTSKIRRWVFPEPTGGGIVRVTYPFVFKNPDAAPTKTADPEQPAPSAASKPSPRPDTSPAKLPAEPGLNLRIEIASTGFTVRATGATLAPVEGCPEGSATVCVHKDAGDVEKWITELSTLVTLPDPTATNEKLTAVANAYDYRRLHNLLVTIKQKYPEERVAVLTASPDVPLEVVAGTMDAIQYQRVIQGDDESFATDEAFAKAKFAGGSGDDAHAPLFSDVSLAVMQ
jgi:TonB family protein